MACSSLPESLRVSGQASGCDQVLASPASQFLGLPLTMVGVGLYLAVALLARRALNPDQRDEAMR